jgi:hypothetical protein
MVLDFFRRQNLSVSILLYATVCVCCVLFFGSYNIIPMWHFKTSQFHSNSSSNTLKSSIRSKYAFAGLLYANDESMFLKYLPLAEAWCYQLKFVMKTAHDVIVYSHRNITNLLITYNQTTLLDLGCKVYHFSTFNFAKEKIQYKHLLFKSLSAFEESILQTELLSLNQYECVIHMDFDFVIQKNLDSLFIHSPHRMYGVPDQTAMLNNGLIVLTPNEDDYVNLKTFWKNAFWGCDGVNNYNPIRRPYFSLLHLCDQTFNSGPQGVLPAYFYQYGEYVQLADVYNFMISPVNHQ